jgi:hypothetical protein
MRQVILEIHPGTPLWRELSSRGKDWDRIIYRDLLRYYAILNSAAPKFSINELQLLRDALHHISLSDMTDRGRFIGEVAAIVERRGLDKTYMVNGAALLEHLQTMPLSDLMAFLDQVERS